jgi:hypothetical protein
MVSLAPRYDIRIVDAVRALDDPALPIAEICRRVGAAAGALGLPRPSYSHLRRVVHAEREHARTELERREAVRALVEDAAADVLMGRIPNPEYYARRLAAVRSR